MKKILIVLCVLFLSKISFTQNNFNTLKNTDEVKKMSKMVADLFYKDSILTAFDQMNDFWPIPQDEIDELERKTVKYLSYIDERFGYRIETLKINEETIKDFAIRETYFIRFERSAIKLVFKYFNTGHGWIINSFKWDDEYSTEFK